jgi:hypothetical protein
VPVLARLFEVLPKSGMVPAAWKTAQLAPIYKKGDPAQTSNERMIAVSPVLYRLFASVVESLLTKWCMREKVLHCGFVPGCNCHQAL